MFSALSKHYINWVAMLIGFFALLPFLCLAFYNHPLGTHEWDWISNWQGTFEANSFWQEQLYWYKTTMGRYFSTAMLSLTDVWYSLSLFQSLFVFNILMLTFLSFMLTGMFWPSLDWPWRFSIAVIVVAIYLHQCSGIYDTIYRYTSLLTYSLGLWLAMTSAILLEWCLTKNKKSALLILLLGLMSLATIGSNEISLISLNLMIAAVLTDFLFKKQAIPGWFKYILFFICLGDLLALAAPGNYQRMDIYGDQPDLFQTSLLVIAASTWLWLDWLGDGLLVIFILLWLPIGWHCRKAENPLFQNAYIWLGATVLIVPLALFPLLLGTYNTSLPERIVDLLFFTVCWTNLGLIQSLLNKYSKDTEFPFYHQSVWMILAAFFTFQLFFAGIALNRSQKDNAQKWALISIRSNIGQAYKYLLDGSALTYHRAMQLQYKALMACEETICKVKAPVSPPHFLYEALSDRRTKAGDPFMGKYFRANIQNVIY